jgi:hypothetical protein
MSPAWPSYLTLLQTGELARRVREAVDTLSDCTCCPRLCHADRHDVGPMGRARLGMQLRHVAEEMGGALPTLHESAERHREGFRHDALLPWLRQARDGSTATADVFSPSYRSIPGRAARYWSREGSATATGQSHGRAKRCVHLWQRAALSARLHGRNTCRERIETANNRPFDKPQHIAEVSMTSPNWRAHGETRWRFR